MSHDTWMKWVQFLKFGLVGVSNTVVSYGIYVLFLLLFEKNHLFVKTDYLLAQGKETSCQCRRYGFDPWVRKIPWRWK